MPIRSIPFIDGQIYHIYNRGVEKRPIFEGKRDYSRFLNTLLYYQLEGPKPRFSNFAKYKIYRPNVEKKIVEIVCYCIMPNHFHLLIRQLRDKGISEFISKLTNSYTKYYNIKYSRVGPLLQGQFKAVLMEDDEQLIHLSRYIHLNPLVSYLVKDLNMYDWSSYKEFIEGKEGLCSKKDVLGFFKSPKDYKQFVLDQADYGKQLALIKHKALEEI